MPDTFLAPFAGFGLGLRPPHYQDFLGADVPVDFVEVISENFMVKGGRPLNVLAAIRDRYPIAMHGVSMSIGSADGIKLEYLLRLKALADRVHRVATIIERDDAIPPLSDLLTELDLARALAAAWQRAA